MLGILEVGNAEMVSVPGSRQRLGVQSLFPQVGIQVRVEARACTLFQEPEYFWLYLKGASHVSKGRYFPGISVHQDCLWSAPGVLV